jgi:hypothetical protein
MAGQADDATFNRNRVLLADEQKQADVFLRRRNEGEHRKIGVGALRRFRSGFIVF